MRLIIGLCVAALLFASCTKKQEALTSPAPSATPAASANCQDRTLPTPTPLDSTPNTKPTVSIPDGPPPCKLVIQDIHVGDGAAAAADSTVTVQYVGVSWSNHQPFDSSWDRGQPATFSLGQVVQGWQQGIPGMKEGGRRELIIPPSLGYGDQGSPPAIGPNETLVFIIDLMKVESTSPTP